MCLHKNLNATVAIFPGVVIVIRCYWCTALLQVKELEELCGAQQNSLEEAEERHRMLQQEHDALHHTALAAKAQLVTAQAQVRGAFLKFWHNN